MFSIFDFLRRRACDAVLTGVYDAMELLESENAEQPLPEIESGNTNPPVPQVAENPAVLPQPQSVSPPSPSQPQPNSSNSTMPKTNPPPPFRPAPTSHPGISQADLLSGLPGSQTLPGMPPRKRGRPSKQQPGGNRQ